MKILERITTGLSVTVLVVCFVALLLFGVSATGWKALAVPTGSMRPAIPPGSLVLVRRVSIASLKVGDVITYINPVNPKTTLSHRIVKKYLLDGKVPAFVTKGDANKVNDIPITAGSIEGQVIWHLPRAGQWLIDLKNPLVILPIVDGAALIIMAEEVIRLRNYLRLGQPYVLFGYEIGGKHLGGLNKRLALGLPLTIAFILISLAAGPTVLALLKSNTVALVDNRLTVSAPVVSNSCSNNNSVTVTNSSTQTATSGSASNTSGGSASSGNASNNNSTNTNITITNC
jgi:signal peptidase